MAAFLVGKSTRLCHESGSIPCGFWFGAGKGIGAREDKVARLGQLLGGVALALIALAGPCALALAQDEMPAEELAERLKVAREVIANYTQRFKVEIMLPIKSDGPVAGVGAYHTNIGELSSRLSEQTPFEIGRTALRLRNPENAPDAWEQATMEAFVKQISDGADPAKLEAYQVATTQEGQRILRYMSPIMMRDTCLACHGADVRQDVKQEIAKYYPDDKAIGYRTGEMRGAYSLEQQLD